MKSYSKRFEDYNYSKERYIPADRSNDETYQRVGYYNHNKLLKPGMYSGGDLVTEEAIDLIAYLYPLIYSDSDEAYSMKNHDLMNKNMHSWGYSFFVINRENIPGEGDRFYTHYVFTNDAVQVYKHPYNNRLLVMCVLEPFYVMPVIGVDYWPEEWQEEWKKKRPVMHGKNL